MAEKTQAKSKVSRFIPVTAAPPERGFYSKNTEGMKVKTSGLGITNTKATDILDEIAKGKKMAVDKYGVAFGADPEARQVSVYVIDPVAEGETERDGRAVSPVKRYKGKTKQLGIPLGGVFAQYPAEFKDSIVRDCKVFRYMDGDIPCMVISFQTAVPYISRSSKRAAKAAPKAKDGKDTKGTDGTTGTEGELKTDKTASGEQ